MEVKKKRLERKKNHMKRLKRIRLFLIVLAIIIAAYIFFIKLPLFSIKNISVKNNHKIQDNQIVKSSGIVLGENIFKIDKKTIESNLKSKEPYVKSVEISRKLPNTIFINIIEKKDIYAIFYGKKLYFIGKEAMPLSEIDVDLIEKDDKKNDIPILEGLSIKKMLINEPIKIGNKGISEEEFKKFSLGIERDSIRESSKRIEITDDSEVNIIVSDYQIIKLGKFKNMDYKTKVLDKILKDLKKKKIRFKTIDFTKSKKVIVEKLTEKDLEEIENKKEENEVNQKEEDLNEEDQENIEGNNPDEIVEQDKEIEEGEEEKKAEDGIVENTENHLEDTDDNIAN